MTKPPRTTVHHLERHPAEGEQAAGARPNPQWSARALQCGRRSDRRRASVTPQAPMTATKPGPDRGRRRCPGDQVATPSATGRSPLPGGGWPAGGGRRVERHRWHGGPAPAGRAEHQERGARLEEERREHQDHEEARHDEAQHPDQRRGGAAQPPGAVDGELRRGPGRAGDPWRRCRPRIPGPTAIRGARRRAGGARDVGRWPPNP